MVCGCSVVFATSAAHNSNIQHGLMYGGQARAPHNQRRTAAGILQGGAQKKRRAAGGRGGRQIAGISQLATTLLKFNPPPQESCLWVYCDANTKTNLTTTIAASSNVDSNSNKDSSDATHPKPEVVRRPALVQLP